MSLAEFDALPREVRAEYVDGVALMTPPSSGGHQSVETRLIVLLYSALAGAEVRPEAGYQFPWGTRRIADVAVQRVRDDVLWSTETPVVVVEVLSPSTRNEDLFRKTRDYLRAGVEQYWIVDRAARTVTVLHRAADDWEVLVEVSDRAPVAEVAVSDLGTVTLELARILSG